MLGMANFFHSLQMWLQQVGRSLNFLFLKESREDSEPEDSLLQLPQPLRQKLLDQLQALPSQPSYVEQLKTEFSPAFEAWCSKKQDYPHPNSWDTGCHDNVWVIVSPSVANLPDVGDVFLQSIADADSESDKELTYQGLPLRLMQLSARPDVKSLRKTLQQQFSHRLSDEREVVIIPCLENYFLRSVYGLEGIDYLREHLLNDPSRFWILGLGELGWKYLQAIYALDAYSNQITHLSELSDEQLSDWFEPIVSKLNISFQSSSLRSKFTNKELNWREKYFKTLADESDGIDTVAIQLFLNTLQILENCSEDSEQEQSATPKPSDGLQTYEIRAKSPKHPSLPDLPGESIYLLYALLLHRTLTKKELAEALGLAVEQIEHQIQTLRKTGVIEQKAQSLRLTPVYYPTVCNKLAGDNFTL